MAAELAALRADRKRRTAEAGKAAEALLNCRNYRGAWTRVKAWYRHAGKRPFKPSRQDLRTVATESANLPPGDPVPVLVERYQVDDSSPTEDAV